MKKIWISVISIVVVVALVVSGYFYFGIKNATMLKTEKLLTQVLNGDEQVLEKSTEELFEILLSDVRHVNTGWNTCKVLAEVDRQKITRDRLLTDLASSSFGWLKSLQSVKGLSTEEKQEYCDQFNKQEWIENHIEQLILLTMAEREIILTDEQWAEIDEEVNRVKEAMYDDETFDGIVDCAKRFREAIGMTEEEFFEKRIKEPVRRKHIIYAYGEKILPSENYTEDDVGRKKHQQDIENFRSELFQKAEDEGLVKRYY